MQNHVGLVTGASRGIGGAIALTLGKAGAAVAVNFRERSENAEAVAEAIRKSGSRAAAFGADVSVRIARAVLLLVENAYMTGHARDQRRLALFLRSREIHHQLPDRAVTMRRAHASGIWKAAAFLLLSLACVVVAGIVTSMFAPARIVRASPPTPIILVATLFVILATRLVLRIEGRTFADLGISANLARLAQLIVGIAVGAAGFAALAWAFMLAGMIYWQPNHAADAHLVGGMLLYFAAAALIEEFIFRGFALRRLAESIGDSPAVIVMAVLFGAYHAVNVGASLSVQSGGWDLVWRVAGPAAGGLLFGIAAIRTRGIALPFGLHFGGNVVQWIFLTLGAAKTAPGPLTPILGPFAQPALFQVGYMYLIFALLLAVVLLTRTAPRFRVASPAMPPAAAS